MKVTVYTLPICVQCDRTKKLLDREGVEYETVNLADEPELAAQFKEEGFLQAPIVVTNTLRWAGFRPDLIKELKKEWLMAGEAVTENPVCPQTGTACEKSCSTDAATNASGPKTDSAAGCQLLT